MTSLKFVLCLFLWKTALATNAKLSVHQEIGFISANAGGRVTLQCFFKGNAPMFHWYKQTLGQQPRLISTFSKYDKAATFTDELKDNSRFSLEIKKGSYYLIISDLSTSDSATYYCIGCNAYKCEFAETITVSVKGSGLNVPALVHQSVSESIQPGGSVTLNCTVHTGTCDGEHSVYWFKDSGESHPGIIYTHGDRNDQCERKPETQTHTCVYNLPMKSLNRSHAGTYYCAVASCGHILFGNVTELNIKVSPDDMDSVVLVYFLSGAVAFTTTLAVLLALSLYRMNKGDICNSADSQDSPSTVNAEGPTYTDDLHYAALREQRFSGARRQRDDSLSHCVYSSVKQQN